MLSMYSISVGVWHIVVHAQYERGILRSNYFWKPHLIPFKFHAVFFSFYIFIVWWKLNFPLASPKLLCSQPKTPSNDLSIKLVSICEFERMPSCDHYPRLKKYIYIYIQGTDFSLERTCGLAWLPLSRLTRITFICIRPSRSILAVMCLPGSLFILCVSGWFGLVWLAHKTVELCSVWLRFMFWFNSWVRVSTQSYTVLLSEGWGGGSQLCFCSVSVNTFYLV